MNEAVEPGQSSAFSVRTITADDTEHVATVAERMRATLVEVLGDRGSGMYRLEWLVDRVLWHLDGKACDGEIFSAFDARGAMIGHTIVRVEADASCGSFGLVSTTYVLPGWRRRGVARALLDAAEDWFLARGLRRFSTDTSEANVALIRLFESRGYAISYRSKEKEMVRLSKAL